MSSQCRDAALTTYRELTEAGQRHDRAYDAAVQVFRYYHPERQKLEAYQIVADWLDRYEVGADPGGYPWDEAEPCGPKP